jgi:peptidyl-prolyl cis-trans isomerase A (cyclophilin A)
MKTNIRRNQNALVLFIYILAFALMTWSFNARAADKAATTNPEVIVTTSLGKFTIRLNAEKAPISTENFLKYVAKKHYDGTTFHRVIPTFMIQGGGYTADMKEKETLPPIDNEAQNGLSNLRGSVAMARTGEIKSATSQFFINVVDNKRLDYVSDKQYGYAVFGLVTDGMDVVDKIRDVKTAAKGDMDDVPVTPVVIKSIRLVKATKSKGKK